MSTTTPNIGLFKYDTTNPVDLASAFNINTALNNNWDIIDSTVGTGGSQTTVVSGNTWYRQWSDGWKEQGGLVSLSETETAWTQPTLSANGTLGGNAFAVASSSSTAYLAFDKNNETHTDLITPLPQYFVIYNPNRLKVSELHFINTPNQPQLSVGVWCLTAGNLYGSNNNADWTLIKTFTSSVNTYGTSWTINCSENSSFYFYHKIECTSVNGTWNNKSWEIAEIELIATQQTSVANSITFPVSFNNTNYSYTFACQDGGGMDAYVSNKTTTGMTLSNTNSGSASWTACGY